MTNKVKSEYFCNPCGKYVPFTHLHQFPIPRDESKKNISDIIQKDSQGRYEIKDTSEIVGENK